MARRIPLLAAALLLSDACAAADSVHASRDAADWSVCTQLDCVQKHLPRDYSFAMAHSPIGAAEELGELEIRSLMNALPSGLTDIIRKGVKRLWPDRKAFYRAVEKDLDGASLRLLDEVDRFLNSKFNLDECVKSEKRAALSSIWPFIMDVIDRPVRDNAGYKAMGRDAPYYVLMMLGGQANGYAKATAHVREYAPKQ